MKFIYSIIVLIFFSCTKPTLTGHWKCDKKGIVKAMDKNQQIKSAPVKEFYDLLKISPIEFVFSEDCTAKSISTTIEGEVSELSLTVTNNKDGDASRFLLRDDSDHSNDVIMTLKSFTKTKRKHHLIW